MPAYTFQLPLGLAGLSASVVTVAGGVRGGQVTTGTVAADGTVTASLPFGDYLAVVKAPGSTESAVREQLGVGDADTSARSVRLYAPSGQTLNTGVTTALTGLLQEFNDDAVLYVVNTTNGTVQVTKAGQYLACWTVRTLNGSVGKRVSSIQVGGTDRNKAGTNSTGTAGIADFTNMAVPLVLLANDVVRLAMYQDGGTTATITGATQWDTGFSLTYLGT